MNSSSFPVPEVPLASPPPRVLIAGLPHELSVREVSPVGDAGTVTDALVVTALLAAVAETLMPAAFRCPVVGFGEILLDARDRARPRLLQERITSLIHDPRRHPVQEEVPLVLGRIEPTAAVSAAWEHGDGGPVIRWCAQIPHVTHDELEALTESSQHWLALLSKGGPCPPIHPRARRTHDPVLGGRRCRLDLLHSLIEELGADDVCIDGDTDGIGVTATLSPELTAAHVRAAVRRRMANQPFPTRWRLERTSSAVQSPLLGDFLAACRRVLGTEVGAEDDFFAHGGDSLGAMQVLRHIAEATGHQFDLTTVLHALRTRALGHAAALLSEQLGSQNGMTPPIPTSPEERFAPFPLTPQQQAYVMGRGQEFQQGGLSCHTYQEFDGADVAPERLRRVVNQLHRRHDMLRLRIDATGLTQRVLPVDDPAPFEVVDLRGLSSERLAEALARNTEELSHRVAPLEEALYLIRLLLLPEGRVRLCLSFDALIADLASMGVLLEELQLLWDTPDRELPQQTLLFRDYVLHEVEDEESASHRAAVEYWESKLRTLPPAPRLPVPAMHDATRFVPHPVRIPARVWQQVRSHAGRWGLTASTVLTACHAEVLSHWATSQHFTINVPRFNRRLIHPDVERTVGEFASIILVGIDRRPEQSFGAFARSVQEQIWADLSHPELSGIEILRRLRRHHGADALMPVVLTSATFMPGDPTRLIGLDRVLRLSQTPQVDLDCIIEEADGDLIINWDHRAGRIAPEVVAAMAESFTELLCRLTRATTWSELDPASTETTEPTRQGPATEIPLVHAHEAFFNRAQEDPQAVALLSPTGTVTRGVLAAWAMELISEWDLRSSPPTPVALLLDKSPEQIAAVFAVTASGRAYVPLDASAPPARLRGQIEASGATAVVVPPSWDDRELGMTIPHLRVGGAPEVDDVGVPTPPAHGEPGLTRCAIIFTSGSTGEPKGVAVTHEAIVNCVEDTCHRLSSGPSDRFLAISALHHDMSMFDLFGVLGSGGQLVVPTSIDLRDADATAVLVERHRVTGWVSVPALAQMLTERAQPGQIASLRQVILGGDWVQPTLVRSLSEAAPGVRVVSVGGPTETTMWNIWHDVEPGHDADTVPYGLPLNNTSYRIVDERMRTRPPGARGTMVCSGVGVSPGYLGDVDSGFTVHPVTGEWIYITGDLGVASEDGPIWFLGRGDRQLQVNGYRVEPAEIEQVLLSHPMVTQALVTGVERTNGPGHQALVAHVVAPGLTRETLHDWLVRRLPAALLPRSIVVLDEFPLTPNGKIDRTALLGMATEAEPGEEPSQPLQAVLSQLCGEELGLSLVNPRHDLFSLGADSLFAARLATRVDAELPGLRLTMRDIFLTPTIADLAAVITDRAPRGVADRIATLWLDIAQLDDEQLARLVVEKR